MKAKNTKTKRKSQGYILIEAAFCVFVVGLTLVAFLQVMSKMFVFEFNKRDSIIASNLAQEGVEIIRNIRDNNWKAVPPRDAFANPFPGAGTYRVVYNSTSTLPNSTAKLRRNNTTGFYDYVASGKETKFSRTVTIAGGGDSRTITSTVTWRPIGSPETETKIVDTLYAWGDPE